MVPKDSFMYTFETGSGGLYFVIKGYAEVVDEHDDSKYNDTGDDIMVIASIQEGMFFGHESLLNSTFDFLGIRAKSDLSTLFISNENLSRMKHEVPLVYDTLFYVVDEAVKISFGTYDLTTKNVSVRNFEFKRNKDVLISSSRIARTKQKLGSSIRSMYDWINSDVDEAKSLYLKLSGKSAMKARRKKIDDKKKLIMSDGSYEKFLAMKAKRLLLDMSPSPMQPCRSSGRHTYASLYKVNSEDKSNYCKSLSVGSEKYSARYQHVFQEVNEEEKEEEDNDFRLVPF